MNSTTWFLVFSCMLCVAFCDLPANMFVIGGDFGTSVDGIEDVAAYDLDSGKWLSLGGGFPFRPPSGGASEVSTILQTNMGIIFSGYITATVQNNAGNQIQLNNIALYNPTTGWDNLNGGVPTGTIMSVASDTSNAGCIFISGSFSSVGSDNYLTYVNNTARWCYGKGWAALDTGLSGTITTNLRQWFQLINGIIYPTCNITSDWYSLVQSTAAAAIGNSVFVSGVYLKAGNVSYNRFIGGIVSKFDIPTQTWAEALDSKLYRIDTDSYVMCCQNSKIVNGTPDNDEISELCDTRSYTYFTQMLTTSTSSGDFLLMMGNFNQSVLVYNLKTSTWVSPDDGVEIQRRTLYVDRSRSNLVYAVPTNGQTVVVLDLTNFPLTWRPVTPPQAGWRLNWVTTDKNGVIYGFGSNTTGGFYGQMLQMWNGAFWEYTQIFRSLMDIGYHSDFYVPRGRFVYL